MRGFSFVGETPLVSNADGVNYSVRWFESRAGAFADVRNVDFLLPGVQPVLSSAALYQSTHHARNGRAASVPAISVMR